MYIYIYHINIVKIMMSDFLFPICICFYRLTWYVIQLKKPSKIKTKSNQTKPFQTKLN